MATNSKRLDPEEFDFRGLWSPGEERMITELVDGLNDALTGLEGRVDWWPSTFLHFSRTNQYLRGFLEVAVVGGSLEVRQLHQRVLGHLPAGWSLDDYVFIVSSGDREDVVQYAELIGAEVVEGDLGFDGLEFGPNSEIYGAIIHDEGVTVTMDRVNVQFSMHGEYRYVFPPFGMLEPLELLEETDDQA